MKARNPMKTEKKGEGNEKGKPELARMEEGKGKWFIEPVPDSSAYVVFEYQELDVVQPLESVGERMGHREIPLSPQESSNKDVVDQLPMKKPRRALEDKLMDDGISLSDLQVDLQEGQGSTSDLEDSDEIVTHPAKDLKP